MQTIVVDDFESAMQALVASYDTDFCAEGISLGEGINLHIKLRGEQWGGELDYRIAEFIIQLQKDIIALYNAHSEQAIRYRSSSMEKFGLVVQVEVKAGCTDLTVFFKTLAERMDKKYIVPMLAFSVITAGGVYAVKEYIQAQKEICVTELQCNKEVALAETDKDKEITLTEAELNQELALAKMQRERISPNAVTK